MNSLVARPMSVSGIVRHFIIVGAFLAMLLAAGCGKEMKSGPPPPPAVEVVDVVQKDVPIHTEWVGSLDGMVNATIRAQVTGYLVKQNYTEGDVVRKGQVLFEIDPRTFKAAADAAKGSLDQAEARWSTAKANLERIRPLSERNAVSKKDLDDATGAELSSRAAVVSARAQMESAELNLGFTRVTSPVTGIAGIAKAQIGNLVGPGQISELTTVSAVDPIKVYFSISEQEYMNYRKWEGKKAGVEEMQREARQRTQALPIELVLPGGAVYPHKGKISISGREVDVKTGTLTLGAVFPNPGNMLRPGQFAIVRAIMQVKKGALLIPQRAVTDMQGKYLVAVVGADNVVDVRMVTPADRIGSMWIIDKGLKPGDRIVSEGVQKVKTGIRVLPKHATSEAPMPPAPPASPPTAPAKGGKG